MKITFFSSSSPIERSNAFIKVPCCLTWTHTLVLLMAFIIFTACASKADRDQAKFKNDSAAVTEVRRIQTLMSRSQILQQNDLDLLKTLHTKYPEATEVRQIFQNALQTRQDWVALEKLLTEKPGPERSTLDQALLAKVYIKLGRYKVASRIIGPLADAAPTDLELNSIAGHAWYFEGKYDDAARAFDRVWDKIIATKQIDEIMLRGMIYFYKGDRNNAIETLKKTIQINPDYIAGNNALSRVFAANGDEKQAEFYRAQAETAHARQTADESRRMRVTSRAHDLENAFAAARYDDCIQIAREMLQSADASQKPVLYEYLGKAYQATGRETEAQEAFREAARLRE